jgi:hypothetical protein
VPWTLQAVIELAAQTVGGKDGIFVAPAIPPRKEKNVRALYAASLPADEPIAVLFDDTVFGAGDDGFIVTPARICWRNFGEEPKMIPWPEVASVGLAEPVINGGPIKTTSGKGPTLAAAMQLFRTLALPSSLPGTPAIQGLAAEPCKVCGGGEYTFVPRIELPHPDGASALSIQALICRSCRHTHLFDVEKSLERRFHHEILKAPERGPYR